jgi:nucleoside-diphosphate-sugar epimerase
MIETRHNNCVGVLGASSFVGGALLPLLTSANYRVSAFSRHTVRQNDDGINWVQLQHASAALPDNLTPEISSWVCVAPIWVLSDYLPWIKSMGAQRVVAMSSTSLFTKTDSSDLSEQSFAKNLAESEQQFIDWAQANCIEWIILRPTLIYGLGLDKNICEIARFIRRFKFFPLFGKAQGLRQPVHVEDLAHACMAALTSTPANQAYNLSGGERLSYREMVTRIFNTLGLRPRWLTVPLPAFRLAVALLRCIPRYRKWTSAMAERMNRDMVFDHVEANIDLGFSPRPFVLTPADLPR